MANSLASLSQTLPPTETEVSINHTHKHTHTHTQLTEIMDITSLSPPSTYLFRNFPHLHVLLEPVVLPAET